MVRGFNFSFFKNEGRVRQRKLCNNKNKTVLRHFYVEVEKLEIKSIPIFIHVSLFVNGKKNPNNNTHGLSLIAYGSIGKYVFYLVLLVLIVNFYYVFLWDII